MKLLIFCTRPGLNVAGVAHPQFAAHPLTAFTEEQLRALIADRHISLAVGDLLTADTMTQFQLGSFADADLEAKLDGRAEVPDGGLPTGAEIVPAAEAVKARARRAV
jgi:hypothetical protein